MVLLQHVQGHFMTVVVQVAIMATIKILLAVDVGVIDADSPVTSTKEVDEVENVSVLVVLTTCNTLPGNTG
jgi:hypothetical protein